VKGLPNLKLVGLIAGPIAFLLLNLAQWSNIGTEASQVIAVAAWMIIWWIFEAVPLAVTALLPVVLFPLTGISNVKEATAPYGDRFVFLFLGGFMLALAMEKWDLHKRIALRIVLISGSSALRIIMGFMIATAFLSMWISNTATTLMMLPIAASVIGLVKGKIEDPKMAKKFAVVLLLSIAYAANCGGIATLVGTPPNLAMAGAISEGYGIKIGFLEWMVIGLPFSLLMLTLTYFLLTRVLHKVRIPDFEGGKELIQSEYKKLGALSGAERLVLWVFIGTALLWVTKSFINSIQNVIQLNDTSIAIFSAILLFIFNAGKGKGKLLTWEDTSRLPWGILLLFGGGLNLANAFKSSGLMEFVAGLFIDQTLFGILGMMLILTVIALFLTEVMSNLALVVVFVPVVAAIADGMGLSPLQFAVPVTLAASCAFMFPMATPPNAIVFATGEISIPQMARTGLVLNIVAAVVATLFCSLVLEPWLAYF
jgi:sodium-dependent dicarboxylate transporter 2/3/5